MQLFSFFLITHIITGTICLIVGLFAILARKKNGNHTLLGSVYHWMYVIIFVTSIVMAMMHWEESSHLFFVAIFSYSFALVGYIAAKRKRKNWLSLHIPGMLGSYIGIITAILVNNGEDIILINQLPPLILWFLPTIVGTPFIFLAVHKYTASKKKAV